MKILDFLVCERLLTVNCDAKFETYNSDGIKPLLNPAPNSREERWCPNNEDSVQSFGVVCGGQLTGILHVVLQIPELSQSNI
jgi:hypothetical protein